MEFELTDDTADAPAVRFEPCAEFTADARRGSEICEHCGWLDPDHRIHDDHGVVTPPRPVLPRAA